MKEMFTAVERIHPAWRLVFPFQSVAQFASYVASAMVGLLVVALVAVLALHKPLTATVAFACFAGALPFVYATLPARFVVAANSAAAAATWHDWLRTKAQSLGYRDVQDSGSETTCRSGNLFGLLPWAENTIRIASEGNRVSVSGPVFSVRVLHRIANK